MKKILIIGIGAGDPEYLTVQAINALNKADVFFILDKGPAKQKLIAFRRDICERYIKNRVYRFVDATSPEWERGTADYRSTIAALNQDKQVLFERLIADGMRDGECGAFLVWGDPTLYDSTIRILDAIEKKGAHDFGFEVIPGITAVQALAAKHKVTLNRIGGSIGITTGRKAVTASLDAGDSLVVMLDAENAYQRFAGHDVEIFWGAYVGSPDEILIAGKLDEVAGTIAQVRAEARGRNGWIMDTYLIRRTDGNDR
ncbi:MAG TPA: precorrin-6A synthase (deacetylating) [Stellaceae bacterium]|jgi:precorrin-6A synthase|nr:precorrin-6A synthase (deacetylating) [Stellaceae bacterium]